MHLYIHIPFCHRICPYCAFFKHTPAATDLKVFVRALVVEARLRLPDGYAPRTIFMGGGTPSMLSPTRMRELVEGLTSPRSRGGAGLDLSRVQEWTLEANPATFNLAKARLWRELGVTRLSLGIQSFDAELLQLLGRTHSPEQARRSVAILREAGMPQVNIDLMFSLPRQGLSQWEESLRGALALAPEHISTYNLTYEQDTAFYQLYGADAGDEQTDVAMFELAHELLTAAGYRHYEVSNYAREGARSLHNLATWAGKDYYGLGPGAVGTIEGMRYENLGNTTQYNEFLMSEKLPPARVEQLSDQDRRTEIIGLKLRTDEGLELSLLRSEDATLLAALCEEGLARIDEQGQRLILTRQGRLLVDEIATQLLL